MSTVSHDPFPTSATVVSVDYADIQDSNTDISTQLEVGFGPNGLGIIAVSGVPGYGKLRKQLLSLSERLATLPQEAKKKLENPESRYAFGWSHGKEVLESGQPDILKGSFYANPIYDIPTFDAQLMQRYPSYCCPNLWPRENIPDLEPTFKELGKLIIDVGLLLAHHCDKYVASMNPSIQNEKLKDILVKSQCHKGRLLHYFAPATSALNNGGSKASSWCGWHTDHGSLTGLTAALYMKDGEEVVCPDNRAGLYVKTHRGEILKATFQADQIGYQMGEATEFLSCYLFHATPHCVQTAHGPDAVGVTRNTFAVFMQPNWDQPLKIVHKQVGHITFGDFSEKTLDKYYRN